MKLIFVFEFPWCISISSVQHLFMVAINTNVLFQFQFQTTELEKCSLDAFHNPLGKSSFQEQQRKIIQTHIEGLCSIFYNISLYMFLNRNAI